jgi:hypothetical protein
MKISTQKNWEKRKKPKAPNKITKGEKKKKQEKNFSF